MLEFYLVAELSSEPVNVILERLEQEAFAKVWTKELTMHFPSF